jgi:hypothetical protein
MPIYKDSYETTVGSMFVTKQIETAIKESIIKDNLGEATLNVKHGGNIIPIFITGTHPSESGIPLFTHPISIFNFSGKNYLCTDLRFFIKKDTSYNEIELGVKNFTEYNFSKSRAVLNLSWLDGGVSQMKTSLSFGGIVFSGWISELIAKTYALDFKDQTTLAIIASFYYQSLFSDQTVFDEDTKQKMAVHTIKATSAPAETVFAIFDKISDIKSINDFITNVVNILENVRLKDFNFAMLLTLAKNSWYGTNSKEIISVAMEHPPTWLAIVYTALNEKTYKSSMVYKIAERFGKRGGADEFNMNYVSLVKERLSVAREELVFPEPM